MFFHLQMVIPFLQKSSKIKLNLEIQKYQKSDPQVPSKQEHVNIHINPKHPTKTHPNIYVKHHLNSPASKPWPHSALVHGRHQLGIAPLRGVTGLLAEARAVGEPRGVREPIDGPMAMCLLHCSLGHKFI